MRKFLAAFMMSFLICTVTVTALYPAIITEAHSGRTDGNGGHRDNRNRSGLGYYHYHHGYPAHLHTNGVCPYADGNAVQNNSPSASTQQSDSERLRTKYQVYTDDYNNKLQSGYFNPDINAQVSQFINAPENVAYLQSLLTPEEAADLSGSTDVQADILSRILYLRVYEVFAQQQSTAQQNNQPAQNENAAGADQADQNSLLYRLVTQVQTQLQLSGFYMGDIDGVFDVETQQALIGFQNTYGLTPDGIINEQVIAALNIQL